MNPGDIVPQYIPGATYLIYCLIDPTTSNVFYVGSTPRSITLRLKEHHYESRQKAGAHRKKNIEFRRLVDVGITPMIELLEEVKDPWVAEAWWVYQYKYVLKHPVLNDKPQQKYCHARHMMDMQDEARTQQLLYEERRASRKKRTL